VGGFAALGAFPSHRAGATFFRGIDSLPPSTYCLLGQSSEKSEQYWRIPDAAGRQPPEAEVQDTFRELLTDSIRLRVRSDVPVGTCLSGGLDSSTIVALVRQLMVADGHSSLEGIGSRQHTFSAVYEDEGEWNERVHVDRVLAHTGAAGHFVIPTGEGLWDEIQTVLRHQDEPVQSSAIYAQWCVMRLAKQRGVTVLLDGQGADELLAGYRPYPAVLQDLLRSFRVLAAWRTATQIRCVAGEERRALLSAALRQLAIMRIKRWLGVRSLRGGETRWEAQALSAAGLRESCRAATLEQVAQVATDATQAQHESLDAQLRYQMTEESLPNLLRYEDRNSMAFSLEARVPFLDYRLVEFVFEHAARLRFRAGWTKWIQRNCMAGELPAEIAWRRDKVGYDVPEVRWLRSRRSDLLALFASVPSFSDHFDVDFVRTATAELLERGAKRDGRRVWRWLNLALWLKSLEAYRGAGPSDRQRSATLSCVPAT
jgi:asparagine synthase (glutamine-hydrolysing)